MSSNGGVASSSLKAWAVKGSLMVGQCSATKTSRVRATTTRNFLKVYSHSLAKRVDKSCNGNNRRVRV